MHWKRRIRDAFEAAGTSIDDAVVEELAEHAADLERDAMLAGHDATDAGRRIDDEIAGWVRHAPARSRRRPPLATRSPATGTLEALSRDVLHALRVLLRQPGPSAVGAVTIGLAIGAVAIMAALVWRVLYEPLPWPDSERLVRIYESRRGGSGSFGQFGPIVTNGAYLAWQRSPATIEGIAAWSPGERTLSGVGPAERLRSAGVSPSLFEVLRVSPARGRAFSDGDTPAGAPRVALISDAFWRLRLGGAPDVLGRVVRLDGEPHTVVGVMGPRFVFPDANTAVWLPMDVPPTVTPGSSNGNIKMFSAMARLRRGATVEQAAAEATARAQAAPNAGPVALAVFGSDGPADVRVVPAIEDATREVRPALLALLAAVGLLLLASAGNVANVQLARALARRRELAIRSALGANPLAIARQIVVESVIVGAAGGVVGLALAAAVMALLPAWLPADFPRIDRVAMDWRGALGAMAAALAAGAAAGLLPAWHARRSVTAQALAEDGQSAVGLGRRTAAARARSVVMAAQVAIATVLLAGSVLLGRSFVALLTADRGFDTTQVLTAQLPIPGDTAGTRRKAVLDQAIARLQAIPGVVAAGYTSILPLSGSESVRSFEMQGRNGRPIRVRTSFRVVSDGYMKAIGMRLRSGRLFGATDTATARPVCVVNAAFARAYLGGRTVGTAIPGGGEGGADFEVVGVVADVRTADTTPVGPELFVPQAQWTEARVGGDPVIAARTVGPPVELAAILRSLVADIDPGLALGKVATMEDRVVELLARPRLYLALLGAFAILALAIAAVGLFGVLSFSVAQRSRELAIRSALGASPGSLLHLVLRQGLGVAVAGLAAGLVGSLALASGLGRWLHGVTGTEPGTYVVISAILLAVVTLACAAPALRAARLDPMAVLKRG